MNAYFKGTTLTDSVTELSVECSFLKRHCVTMKGITIRERIPAAYTSIICVRSK